MELTPVRFNSKSFSRLDGFFIGGMLITDWAPRPSQSGSHNVRVSMCGLFTKVVIVNNSIMVRVFVFFRTTIRIG